MFVGNQLQELRQRKLCLAVALAEQGCGNFIQKIPLASKCRLQSIASYVVDL